MRYALPLLALATFASLPAFAEDTFKGLKPVDPDGDCTIEADAGGLSISIPGTPHDLSIELGRMNAPQALRRVMGDFIAEVKVAGSIKPDGATIPERLAYQGSGLLLIQDPRTYIRLERAAVARPGELLRYVSFEVREDRRRVAVQSQRLADDGDLWLRLERRSDRILASISPDGDRWKSLEPVKIELGETLQIGVAAVNAADQPFDTRFEAFRLFLPDETSAPDAESP